MDDLTQTTWIQVWLSHLLFYKIWHKESRLPCNTCLQMRCRFKSTRTFSYQWHWERGKPTSQKRGCKRCNRFTGTQKDKLKNSYAQISAFVPFTHVHIRINIQTVSSSHTDAHSLKKPLHRAIPERKNNPHTSWILQWAWTGSLIWHSRYTGAQLAVNIRDWNVLCYYT